MSSSYTPHFPFSLYLFIEPPLHGFLVLLGNTLAVAELLVYEHPDPRLYIAVGW